ncbi:CBS domain-containing protein [Robertkochia aurantiaca]|uniref:CBS domain-containing protein n=1 Tax=Robertkochia aurantiaca TaxID=2873700 RepID=UPI001CCDD7E4|nr:CBS domain-containing protein [Robertkochia sp. 3YJGBD-33]
MGYKYVKSIDSAEERALYHKHLLSDVAALERIYNERLFEADCIRIGAEQELCLIDNHWYPSTLATDLLEAIDDPHFTTEIACYNLEINLDPIVLRGECFSQMQRELERLLDKAAKHAAGKNVRILLTGILPTISKKHLAPEYMTPLERYAVLDRTLRKIRGRDFDLHIKGIDELLVKHDSVLFEGCNTSFQAHLQVVPDDFVKSYNWAQVIAGPLLAISTNSPLLMGKELWEETRIALFAQSTDTRSSSFQLNEREARVSFGDDWAQGDPVDIFKQDIIRFRSIISSDFGKTSMEELDSGKIPSLKALGLHNGTIYRWNRPCYGVSDGKPHLRIENRYLPAGPTVIDEVANMMFWVGMMSGRPAEYDRVQDLFEFRDVKANFLNAARHGMSSQIYWEGEQLCLDKLVQEILLPVARRGLRKRGVSEEDIDFYLKVITRRIEHQGASRWMRKSYRNLRKKFKKTDACRALTAAIYHYQSKGNPVSSWRILQDDVDISLEKEKRVDQHMNRVVETAQEEDNVAFLREIMRWRKIHHMPVIDSHGKLTGIVTSTDLDRIRLDGEPVYLAEVMKKDVITIEPWGSMKEAGELMRKHDIGCLPVVQDEYLVGILTRNDL